MTHILTLVSGVVTHVLGFPGFAGMPASGCSKNVQVDIDSLLASVVFCLEKSLLRNLVG